MWGVVNTNCLSAILTMNWSNGKIQLGDSNFEYVEVLSGLQPGDRVVISDMSAYKNKK